MPPKASIITPTYNGEKKILSLLRALQNQSFQDFEWIVVIDGSTDETKSVLDNKETTFQKTVLVQANQGRSVAKNNGAKKASSELLIFYDDDMIPANDSVAKHIQFHSLHNCLIAGNQTEIEHGQNTDIQNYKTYLSKKWTAKYSDGLSSLTLSNLFFAAANCSMPSKLFWELGGFDERLTDAEDYDLARRALEKSIPVYFDKSNTAIHNDPITCRSYINRIRQYHAAQQKLKALHPSRSSNRQTDLSILKRIFYWMFSFSFWPASIDNTTIWKLLPKFARYKIYDWVIQSLGVVYPWKKI